MPQRGGGRDALGAAEGTQLSDDAALSLSVATEPPAARPPRRLPLALTVAALPGALICLVGFLAWAIPLAHLRRVAVPLSADMRGQVRAAVIRHIQQTWDGVYLSLWELHRRWEAEPRPLDALTDAQALGEAVFPVLLHHPDVLAAPFLTVSGRCFHFFLLIRRPGGWAAGRQNCSHFWFQGWDPEAVALTDYIYYSEPAGDAQLVGFTGPVLATTPANPFTWTAVWNPEAEAGDLLEAVVGRFDARSNLVGRAGLSISLGSLRAMVQQALQRNYTAGGRLALYEPGGLVIAASHGRYDLNQRFPLALIGDPDLEAAAAHLQHTYGDLCHPLQADIDLSIPYFIDTAVVTDSHASVLRLQWCVLLLTPQVNVLGPVQQSLRFAICFVSAITGIVVLLSTAFGLVLSSHIHRLARGLHALRRYDFPAARKACGVCTVFRELRSAQLAYDALVDAMDAFRKYVPESVVRGLLAHQIQPLLGMVKQNVAVAFMDLENFTAMCHGVPVAEVIALTSQLFDACTAIICSHDGVIDKFMGDCIMALWGAPLPQSDPGHRAAHGVHRVLQFLRTDPVPGPLRGAGLAFRIGLHCGDGLVGNFGASSRWGYTAIGDVVNVAARLEALNKQLGTQCLVSAAVCDALDAADEPRRCTRPMGRVRLLGRQRAVAVYELGAEPPPAQVAWEDALRLFGQGLFQPAAWQLASLKDDGPSRMLLQDLEDAWAVDGDQTCVRVMRGK